MFLRSIESTETNNLCLWHRGWLSQAWLPEETLLIDYFPARINHPRRHAFRYVKFEVIATSVHFAVK